MNYNLMYTGDNSGSGPSPAIWASCPWLEALGDPNIGYGWWDDFLAAMALPTTAQVHGGYLNLDTGDCTLTASAKKGGELQLFCTTDNQDCGIQLGSGAPFIISDAEADAAKLWFEARVKKSIIDNDQAGMFVGLAGEGALAATFIAALGNDFSDVDLIGFWNDESDDSVSSHIHFVYQITGQAFVTKIDTVATLVADTYIKLGFVYDPEADARKRIKIFVDGVEQTTYVTATDIATATFPDGEEMSPIYYISAASGDDVTHTMDWWRCFQRRVS